MKKHKIAILFLLFVNLLSAQRWGLDPSLSFLDGQKELNIEFDYDSMTVTNSLSSMGADLETNLEPDFIKQTTLKFNNKNPGKGDEWAKEWYDARKLYFEPKFEEAFKEKLKQVKINATEKNNLAKYTLIIKVTNITFGRILTTFSGGGSSMGMSGRRNRGRKIGTYADYFVTIVETNNHAKLMARASAKLVFGKGVHAFAITKYKAQLAGACFEKGGKMFGKSIVKALRK